MAARKFLFMASDGYTEEGATSDSTTLGGLTMGGNIDMNSAGKVVGSNAASTDGDLIAYGQASANLAGLTIDTADLVMTSRKITSLADGSAAGDAVNKGQLDQAVISGGTVKEALLHEDQVNDAEGVLACVALTMANQPISGDLITIDDGTTDRTYGCVAGGDVQYAIGGSVAVTMQNLVDAINGDGSAIWGADFSTDLDAIDTDGVVVITEDDNDGNDSKIYGVWTTQADADIVDFGGESDYTKKTLSDMPATEPGSTNFGMNRTQSALTDGEMHYVLNNDVIYSWDDSSNAWNEMSGGGSIPDATGASGGGTKGKATYDTDYGLAVASGIVTLNMTADKGLQFNSGALEIEIDDTPNTLDADSDGLKVVGLPSLFEINDVAVGASVTTANLDDVLDGSDADALHTHTNTSVTVTHASTTGQTVDDHHARDHAIDGATHTLSGATIGHILTATGATTFAFQAPGASEEAQRVENLLTAVENVTKADPLYHSSTADKFGKADAGTDSKAYVFGVAKADIAADAAGEVVSYGPAAGILSGATAGNKYYLQDGGGIGTSVPGAAKRVILIGWAMNATTLWIQPIDFGKKAA